MSAANRRVSIPWCRN